MANTESHENNSLKQELDRVRKERDKYKKIFEVSADSLYVIDYSSMRFIECNDAALHMHGIGNDKNLEDVSPSDISPIYQPCGRKSQDMQKEYLNKTVNEGPQVFQWLHTKTDGSTFPCLVSLTAFPIENKLLIFAVARDISNLINTQQDLEVALHEAKSLRAAYNYEKKKFEQFVNLAPVGIAINSLADGSFIYVNDEFSRFTGYNADQLNKMDYWQLTPKEYEPQEAQQLVLMQEKGRYGPYKKHYIHSLGHTYPVLLSGVKIIDDDGSEFIWSVVQDISHQQKAEDALRQAKVEAESSNRAKSLFVSNISHEIRTPMNGMLGSLQLLQLGDKNTQDSKHLTNAMYSAKSLLRIIDDILDYSKMESNKLTLEEIEFSMVSTVDDVITNLSEQAKEKDLHVSVDIEPDMPAIWIGDPVRIRQILVNILSNAIKFTERGSIKLSLKQAVREGVSGLTIGLVDTGIGMSKETIDDIFERFSQADTSIKRRFGGTGLGMSITKNLVELMGGEINVASKLGAGTKFVIFLPLHKTNTTILPDDVNMPITAPNLAGVNILIAEDNMINREVIGSMLESTHANVCFAENGKVAIDKFSRQNHDVIFMDIQMPIVDGIEAFKRIRKISAKVPIIALTANAMNQDIEEYKSLGFTAYLAKPFDIAKIYETLKQYTK